MWLFVRQQGELQRVLTADGAALLVRSTQSFRDVITVWHRGGGETGYDVFRWDGHKYTDFDCYVERETNDGRKISDCE